MGIHELVNKKLAQGILQSHVDSGVNYVMAKIKEVVTLTPGQAYNQAKAELLSALEAIDDKSSKSIEDLTQIGNALAKYLGDLSPFWAKGGLFGRCGRENQDKVAIQQVLTEVFKGLHRSSIVQHDTSKAEALRGNYKDLSYFTREKLANILSVESIGNTCSPADGNQITFWETLAARAHKANVSQAPMNNGETVAKALGTGK